MSEEIYNKMTITRDDLLDWIDRPPSNADIELADYLVNALDNQRKYYEENTQFKSVLKEIREYVDNKLTDYNLRYGITNEFRCEWDDLLEIIDKGIGEDK